MRPFPALRRLIPVAAALLSSAGAAQPIAGFNVPSWSRDGYAAEEAGKSLAQLAETGAGWIALTPTQYMRAATDSDIFRTAITPSDESLRTAIHRAHALGLKVVIKPQVDVVDGTSRLLIRAADPAAWFDRYGRMILRYAALARDENVELFVVGTELRAMAAPSFASDWERLIVTMRGVFPRAVTYAANWDDFQSVPFWGALDYIGIDGYFPIAGDAGPENLRRGWRSYAPAIQAVSDAAGKRVLFTEIGLSSQEGAQREPWRYGDFGALDLAVQADYLAAFLGEMGGRPFFAGFLQWFWDPNTAAGGPSDKSMTVQGKPGLDVLKRYFRGTAANPRPVAHDLDLVAARRRAWAVAAGTRSRGGLDSFLKLP